MLKKHFKRKVEVLNAGVARYNSQHSLIDYLFRLSDYKPDLVIIWSGVDDLNVICPDGHDITRTFKRDYSHLLGPHYNMYFDYFYPPLITDFSVL